jgi:NTE family protein
VAALHPARSRPLRQAARRDYAGVDIEDLWIAYFAVSTNLSSYDLHRHRRGNLWAAVRASGAIPVLLPPYYTDEGHMLVDGAILDNVPIRVMHELKSGPNIVIGFEVPKLKRFKVDYRSLPGRAALLKAMVNPFLRRALPAAPGVGTVLMRSLMANRRDFERRLRPEDLLLVLPFPPDMGMLDWHRHTELMDASYRWAMRAIARLRAEGHAALGGGGPD